MAADNHDHYHYKNRVPHREKTAVPALAKTCGTPLCVYSKYTPRLCIIPARDTLPT